MATPTATMLPFYFAYLIPTPTAYGYVEDAARLDCAVEESWLSYEVQTGDTLLALALAADSGLIELREGNCFESIRGIFAGEKLLVPRLPEQPVEAPAPIVLSEEQESPVVGCDTDLATIVAPKPLGIVQDIFALVGSARIPAGGRYQVAIKPAWSDAYHPYLESDQSVNGDVIGLVNTEIFGDGSQRIKLTVSNREGEAIEGGICDIPVVFGSP